MFSRLTRSAVLVVCLALFILPGAADAASVADPAGDVIACTGECSNGDTDLKSLTAVVNGANLDVTISQYGTGGCGSFTNVGYWPFIEVYTSAAAPAGPPTTSGQINSGNFAILAASNGNCGGSPPTQRFFAIRAVPTTDIFGPSVPSLATVTWSILDPNTATLSVPLSVFGGDTSNLRIRAWQTGATTPAGAVDVVPDTGLLAVDGSAGAGGGGGGGGSGGGPLNSLSKLPKSALLNSSFSGKLDFSGPADSVDLTISSGGAASAQAAKLKVVGKKTLKHVGPGLVKFSIPIKKSFRKGIKKGKKVKLTFKAVVHVAGAQPTTLTKKITFKKP
jgi:hypothetical protein